MTPVPVLEKVDRTRFDAEVRRAGRPVILKGLGAHWPAVKAAASSPRALGDYLHRADGGRPVRVSISPKGQKRRFFYNERLSGVTFDTVSGTLSQVVGLCLANQAVDGREDAEAIYMQAVPVAEAAPGLVGDLVMPLLDGTVAPRLWIGNSLRTATHFDYASNIAVHVAGQKTFTLFPPDQAANLYPGPLDVTPAGVPISLVDFDAPDHLRFPRFAQALDTAQVARLEPGDALFIPPLWWHHVDTVGPLNMLVNYWWDEAAAPVEPLTSLFAAAVAIQAMPATQRAAWRELFDHYVFRQDGDPVAHLPETLRGVFGDPPDARALDRLWRLMTLRR